MSERIKDIFFIVGILITIGSFFISNAENIPFVYDKIFVKHKNALYAYNKMRNENTALKMGDAGFDELSELISKLYVRGNNMPQQVIYHSIYQIRMFNWTKELAVNSEWLSCVIIELTFINSAPVSGKICGIEAEINKEYYNKYKYGYTVIVFVIGMLITIISYVLKRGSQENAQ